MHYFTGTTQECLDMIVADGHFSTKPPHRVWETYSEDYIYLIPFDPSDEEKREEAFRFAGEQASFALYELNHTKRVIVEIAGLDRKLLSPDEDASNIGAVKYAQNISVSSIVNIFTDEKHKTDDVLELIALTKYFEANRKNELPYLDFGCFYEDDNELEIKQFYTKIDIPYLDLVSPCVLEDEGELSNLYMDLMDEVEDGMGFSAMHPICNEQMAV